MVGYPEKCFKFLTTGAGVASVALTESQLAFLLSKESYYRGSSTTPEPNSAKTLLPGSQHGVKGCPASRRGTRTRRRRLSPPLSPGGGNEEGKGTKKGFGASSTSQTASATPRGALTRRDLPKHSSLCLIREEKLRSSLSERKRYPLAEEEKSVSEQAIGIGAANSLHARSCRVHGSHSPQELPGNPVFHQQSRVGAPRAITPYPKPVATAPRAHSSAFCNYLSNSFQMSDNRITSTLAQM